MLPLVSGAEMAARYILTRLTAAIFRWPWSYPAAIAMTSAGRGPFGGVVVAVGEIAGRASTG